LLEQSRFFESPLSKKESRDDTLWHVPVSAVSKGKRLKPLLMSKRTARLERPNHSWIKFNANETGFYRTAYSEPLRALLAEAVQAGSLDVRDRLGLMRDIFAIVEAGALDTAEALKFAAHFSHEDAYVVWAEIASSLGSIHARLAHEPFLESYEQFALARFARISKKFSWQTKPKDHMQSLLKVLVLGSLGKYGDAATIARARSLFAAASKGSNRIAPDLRSVVYGIVARHGTSKEHAALTNMYKNATLHEEKNRLGSALGAFRHTDLLEKTLRFSISKDVRPQDSVRMIGSVSANPLGTDLAWRFMRHNWRAFQERYGGSRELSYLIEPMGISCSNERAKEIEEFFKRNPTPGTERTVAQVVERIRSNALWLARDRKKLAAFLAS
jgi:aminopeptidase N